MTQNNQARRQRLRDSYVEFVEQMEPNAFVTLVINDIGEIAEMTRLIGKFCGMMDREICGHKFHTYSIDRRTNGVFFIEHAKTNIHAHGLLRFPDSLTVDLPLLTARKWNVLTKAGTTDFRPVHDAAGVAGYCTKEMATFSFDGDQVVLVSQFMKH
ncbi:hypothetical protein [Rhizobium sp. Leaf262]|uniref:hypothetical protein n=1 Tax=Rhizobium sp. Leaf262 TaxID=1736312 RepID=UPI000713F56E|nr:hypothetical protein [Rhizobium sp. Leaf262]KQO79009.1 hypothetical protein ASF29_04620 [Rhizobium sp. Leaf262]